MCFILCIPTLAYEQAENAAIGIDEFISINLEEISPNEEAMAVVGGRRQNFLTNFWV